MTFTARRGRPRKFTRPAHTVTITLPDDVIESLTRLDRDLSRAIVRLAMPLHADQSTAAVEVAKFGGRAVIVVNPTRALSGMRGVELVPLADGRALIAIDDGMSESQFELAVRDALDEGTAADADRELLERLAAVLRDARRTSTLVLRRIIVLHAVSNGSTTRQRRRSRRR